MNSCFRMLRSGAIVLTLTAAVASVGLARDQALADPAPMASPADRLGSTGNHDTLSSALDATAVLRELSVDRPLTLFAPTDQAFEVMPAERRDMRWPPFVGQVCGSDKLVSCLGFQAASWIWGSA